MRNVFLFDRKFMKQFFKYNDCSLHRDVQWCVHILGIMCCPMTPKRKRRSKACRTLPPTKLWFMDVQLRNLFSVERVEGSVLPGHLHTTVCLHWLGDSSGSLNTINLTSVTLRHSAYSARGHFGPGSDVPQFSFDENLRLRRHRCDSTYFISKDPLRMFHTLKTQRDQWQTRWHQGPDLYLICLLRLKRLLRNYYFLAGTFKENT